MNRIVVITGWMVFCYSVSPVAAILAQDEASVEKVPPNSQASPTLRSTKQISLWIKELDDDRFRVREAATARLSKAGRTAIGPLSKAAISGGLEVTLRCVRIILRLAKAESPVTAQAAREALESLAKPRLTAASDRAAAALKTLDALEAKRALAKVYKLGAERGSGNNVNIGAEVDWHLVLRKKKWTGGSDGLKLFKWLKGISHLSIHGCKLADEVVPHLKQLKHLTKLELYGTRITDEGVEKLRAAVPGVEIDVRHGGLLGVQGQFSLPNCQFTVVRPNSAAAKAGIQAYDIVVKCDGKPIDNFKTLLSLIATKEGGDKLKMKIRRGVQEIDIEVTLGEWGDD